MARADEWRYRATLAEASATAPITLILDWAEPSHDPRARDAPRARTKFKWSLQRNVAIRRPSSPGANAKFIAPR